MSSVLDDAGLHRWPFAFSAASALQLIRFAGGLASIPSELHDLCYHHDVMTSGLKRDSMREIRKADIILMELSTPIEFTFRGFVLNNNQLRLLMKSRLALGGEEPLKLASDWQAALQKCLGGDVERRALLAGLDRAGIRDAFIRELIKETRTTQHGANEIRGYLAAIRDLLPGVPMGMVLYNFSYMPDGRPIEWPAGFKESVIEASENLGIATYDPERFVQKHGVEVAMVPNSGHYRDAFYEVITSEYLVFMASILGKPKFHRLVRAHGVPRLRKLRAKIARPVSA